MAFYVRYPGRKPKTKPPAMHALSGQKSPNPASEGWFHRTLCGRTVEKAEDHVERRFARTHAKYVTCAACAKAIARLPGPFVVRAYLEWDDVPKFARAEGDGVVLASIDPFFATAYPDEEHAEAVAESIRRRPRVESATFEVRPAEPAHRPGSHGIAPP